MLEIKEIIRQVQNGQIDKYELIIEKYKKRVFSIVAKRIPRQEWDIIAQDIFINSFRSIGKFDLNKPFENWLARIAMRNCCDYWRKNKKVNHQKTVIDSEKHEEWLEALGHAKSVEDFEKQVRQSETAEILDLVLKRLKPKDRMIIDLIYMEGWKLAEVAEVLQWNINKLKARAMRARNKMRKYIIDIIDRKEF